ncbi:nucleoside deaminase [Roseovarius sp. SCSIO 43702]|uniref:nucleoside deaminase n=1 Tax=Roseovarius sp. SCSIO 43702 TaxID=2823043 RepID=UPI001C7372DD|nr:nucleoside deaminase [Roseovarius sp. SCSIO 43702]QYX56287.1 nucleoside deaminase [Roseovarius sp. SCSIO 43702]
MAFRSYMDEALGAARDAGARGEVPVGAVLVGADGRVLAVCGNRTRELNDPTAHAEMLAIREGCAAVASERLTGATLWVTLEPCAMCAGAIAAARIARVCYGAGDPKSGGVAHGARVFSHPQCHHVPEVVEGIAAEASEEMLRAFFADRRRPDRTQAHPDGRRRSGKAENGAAGED